MPFFKKYEFKQDLWTIDEHSQFWTYETGLTDWKTCALFLPLLAINTNKLNNVQRSISRMGRIESAFGETETEPNKDHSEISDMMTRSQYAPFEQDSIYHQHVHCFDKSKDEITLCAHDLAECDIRYGGRFDTAEECEDHCRAGHEPPCHSWVWYSEKPKPKTTTPSTHLLTVKGSCHLFSTTLTHREKNVNTVTGDCGEYHFNTLCVMIPNVRHTEALHQHHSARPVHFENCPHLASPSPTEHD